LAALWDDRKSIQRPEFVRRCQQILDGLRKTKSLGSHVLNDAACRWVNQLAAKNDVKLMLDCGNSGMLAVRLRCDRRGEGYFLPRRAKRGGIPIKGKGSKQFPRLKAVLV
jgi:hypothetical protein